LREETTMSNSGMEGSNQKAYERLHRRLEGKGLLFILLTTVAISIGGIVEIVPMFTATYGPEVHPGVTPYTPLEVAGRDIYIREGCYLCHSQWIRPTRAEVLRYGEWTRAFEYRYDRPFLMGSRRMGPDLQRVGGKYPDGWHYEHMRDPRSTSPGSVMPPYAWLLDDRIDPADITASIRALKKTGIPYDVESVAEVEASLQAQGAQVVNNLAGAGIQSEWDTEIVALIAYLQRLGKDGNEVLSNRDAETAGDGGDGDR
jgi:cytochrome c oxidase cbb3-type subunit I/II